MMKNPCLELDYQEFVFRILSKLVPDHIPGSQWKEYLEGRRDKKRNEKEANQHSK
jgi:hypothetical protein